MHVEEISVSASRKYNHPYEQFSNLGSHVTLKATLAADDDVAETYGKLQAQAEELVEAHKRDLIANLERLEILSRARKEISALEASIQRQTDALAKAKQQFDDLASGVTPILTATEKEYCPECRKDVQPDANDECPDCGFDLES